MFEEIAQQELEKINKQKSKSGKQIMQDIKHTHKLKGEQSENMKLFLNINNLVVEIKCLAK